jgi:hypothetical protein
MAESLISAGSHVNATPNLPAGRPGKALIGSAGEP